jgi:DNA polymerase-3 subunit delta'
MKEFAHAYIIEGPPGRERDAFVKEFVKSILCENTDADGRPCGVCPVCRRIEIGSHEDVFEMERSGKNEYVVADSAGFFERLRMSPNGDRNIGIVNDAELLSEIVQNKMLKTLEEPFPGTVIILAVRNRAGLLDTVRSRCVLLRMPASSDGTSGERADADLSEAHELASMWKDRCFFCDVRAFIDKNMKERADALVFLDVLEEEVRGEMLEGDPDAPSAVERIEQARKDVLRGMGHKQALKRLYLEIGR